MNAKDWVERFKEAGINPCKISYAVDGKTRFTWHVDDDDDRFMEVTCPVRESRGYLLVVRDGNLAEAVVLHTSTELGVTILLGTVRTKLGEMVARRPS